MNLKRMIQMQTELDQRIRQEHQLANVNLLEKKILALQIELGELANETRCFKYWSVKPSSSKKVILEEYVDGVHFLLSIGIDLEATDLSFEKMESEQNLTQQFSILFQLSGQLAKTKEREDFKALFTQYLHLGKLLDLTLAEIEEAYIGKNEVNHQRQDQGY